MVGCGPFKHTYQLRVSILLCFLSEEYEDELAEGVRAKVQADGESICDSAYMYHSLCQRWKQDI